MTATASPPDLAELQRRAAERAAARAGGADRLRGHIVCDGLVRIFKTEGVEVVALQGLDLVVDRGELLAIVGASGSGKSTLLNILSGLDVPTAGIARVAGYDLLTMSAETSACSYRRRTVGFVWQQTGRNLLPYLTARENVELPMRLAGAAGGGSTPRAELLDMVGVGYCADRRPAQMSGGEQQRVRGRRGGRQRPGGALRRRADRRARRGDRGGRLRGAADDQRRAGRDHRRGHPRPQRRRPGAPDGRDPRRPDRFGGTADRRGWPPTARQELVTEEYAVLDRAGRMQLPAAFVDALELRDRVRLNLEPDHVEVRPGQERS